MSVSQCPMYEKSSCYKSQLCPVISLYSVKEQYLISTDGHRKDVPTQVPCGKNPLVCNTHYHYSLRLSSHDIWPLISSLEAHLSHNPPPENTAATMTYRDQPCNRMFTCSLEGKGGTTSVWKLISRWSQFLIATDNVPAKNVLVINLWCVTCDGDLNKIKKILKYQQHNLNLWVVFISLTKTMMKNVRQQAFFPHD